MELRHLRYFVAVAEELSFTRASERLHIGQPPLSQQIQALEEEIGATLFDRSRRTIRLTEAGRIFLDDARRILRLTDQAAETAHRVQRGEIGQIKIGFTKSSAFTEIFPQIIQTYRSRYPNVNLLFHEMSTMRQLSGLSDYSLDVGFIRPAPETEIPSNFSLALLERHPLAVVVHEGHRLIKAKRVSLNELKDEGIIMFPRDEGTTLNPLVHRLCTEAGFEPKIAMEAREAATIIGLVAAGCGIAILPYVFHTIGIKGTHFRLIGSSTAMTDLTLASRSHEASSTTRAFLEIAKELTKSTVSAMSYPPSPACLHG
jgi:DNA-binding transcriptional LysR family regulator